MGVGLIVVRHDSNGSFVPISVDEWKNLIEEQSDLRLRAESYLAVDPRSGSRISIQVGEADLELLNNGEWEPFLRYSGGKLATEYQSDFEDPQNPVRFKIAELAKILGAVILTDVGDELLPW